MSRFIVGGWSQTLSSKPLDEFEVMMYGMVTNLDGLTVGTVAAPGWGLEQSEKPETKPHFKGRVLWVYGGGVCAPEGRPANNEQVSRLVEATRSRHWDGVDFDDECNMNINLVVDAMRQLKEDRKDTSFGFIAGYSYNHPSTVNGTKLNDKVRRPIASGHCDRYIHYCYAAAMWSHADIVANVSSALSRTLEHGVDKKKCILALTTRGLTDWNLNYFIDQVLAFDIGELFIWRYEDLKDEHREIIRERLLQ